MVDSRAEIGERVKIGPFVVVEPGVTIGEDCSIEAHAVVCTGVTIGSRNIIGHSAVIGGAPQDRKYNNEPTFVTIGDDNIIREFATLHRATGEGRKTSVGNNNYLMAYTHLGHNVTVENDCTIANNVGVAGHATIETGVNIGGFVGIHQFTRVGKYAMVGGYSKVNRDVPPFMLVEGSPLQVYDINAVGLRRLGVKSNSRLALHKACKLLFRSQMGMTHAVEAVKREVEITDEVQYLLDFVSRMGAGKFGRQDQK